MKKKVFQQLAVFALTTLMAMSLAACGSAAAPSTSGSKGSTQQSTQQGTTQGESSQVSDKEQEPSNVDDLFVAFVNAPNVDVNGFGDVMDMENVKAFIEKQGMTMGEAEIRPVGDLYLYNRIDSLDMDGTGNTLNLLEIRMQETENTESYAEGITSTRYWYVEGALEVETALYDVDKMTADKIPALGGFAGFLAEHNCLSIEDILELIGLDDEELMEALATVDIEEGAYYEMEADTPYGKVSIAVNVYGEFADGNTDTPAIGKEINIYFQEGGAPFDSIWIEDSDYANYVIDDGAAYYAIGGHSLKVEGYVSW